MKVQKIIASVLFLSLATAACQQEKTEKVEQTKPAAETALKQETTTTDKDVIATVNGKNISMDTFQNYVEQKLAQNPADAGNPALILNEMINRELLLQAARAEGVDKNPEVAEQIEFSTNNILVNSLVNDRVKKLDTSDTALQAEYDKQIKGMELKEYKARHILVNAEEEAAAIIKELSEGKDFVALAKEKSVGPSGPNGGDLGWFQAKAMVPEFAEALKTMQKDETSKAPVRTQFGWHILKLEDSRDMEVPTFEESKAQLQTILANKSVQNYMEVLRNKATIDVKELTQPAASAEPAPVSEVTPADTATPGMPEKAPKNFQ